MGDRGYEEENDSASECGYTNKSAGMNNESSNETMVDMNLTYW
jgi:hypothetical protein